MDLTDLPLPSSYKPPVETQDAPASTSASPFAKHPTIAAPKSSAQRQREYRQRIAASRTPTQSIATRISDTERKRNYRLRKAANLALASGPLETTTSCSSRSAGRSNDVQNSTQRQLTNQQRQSLPAEPVQISVQPGTSSDQIEVRDEPMDCTDLPLPSRCNAAAETQDAPASTSATPFAKHLTIAVPKSSAQRQREYRQRIAASRTPAQLIATRISDTERKRNYRLRKAAYLARGSFKTTAVSSSRSAGRSNDVQNSTQRQLTNQQRHSLAAEPAQTSVQPGTSSDEIEVQQVESTWDTKCKFSIMRFTSNFLDNDFGYSCSVCDRLWYKNDLKPITATQLKLISDWSIKENRQLCREEYELVCKTCEHSLNKKSMPPFAKVTDCISIQETNTLLNLIENSSIIKKTNDSDKMKDDEWSRVTEQFNSRVQTCCQTEQQLRLKWDDLKEKSRRRQTNIMNLIQDGGSAEYVRDDEILDRVSRMLSNAGRRVHDSVEGLIDGDTSSSSDDGFDIVERCGSSPFTFDTSSETSTPSPSREVQTNKSTTARNLAIAEYYAHKKQYLDAKLINIYLENEGLKKTNENLKLVNEKLQLEIEKLKIELQALRR